MAWTVVSLLKHCHALPSSNGSLCAAQHPLFTLHKQSSHFKCSNKPWRLSNKRLSKLGNLHNLPSQKLLFKGLHKLVWVLNKRSFSWAGPWLNWSRVCLMMLTLNAMTKFPVPLISSSCLHLPLLFSAVLSQLVQQCVGGLLSLPSLLFLFLTLALLLGDLLSRLPDSF